jgi:hypothetical protein
MKDTRRKRVLPPGEIIILAPQTSYKGTNGDLYKRIIGKYITMKKEAIKQLAIIGDSNAQLINGWMRGYTK